MGDMKDGHGEPTAYEVVEVTPATSQAYLEVDRVTWFEEPDPTDTDPLGSLEPGRMHAATPTGEPPFAGIYAWHDLRLTVPQPGSPGSLTTVPCAGLTWVAVHPDHRRTGVLTAMADHHLRSLHEAGVAVGGLHASEVGIYGRFGYAQASLDVRVHVERGAEVTAPGIDTTGTRTRLLPAGDPDVARRVVALHRTEAASALGQVTLPERALRRAMRDSPAGMRGSEPTRVLLAERDGRDVGYALLRRSPDWTGGTPRARLRCWHLGSTDAAARLALLRRLVAFDLTGPVELRARSLEDPVIWWLGGPRSCHPEVADALWVRLVELPAALEQRGWSADADVVLEVADEACPWNAGRWRLTVEGARARCVPTGAPADLDLPVQALGSAYLGGRSVTAQAEQGLVTERTVGAVAVLSGAMATPGPPAGAVGF